MNHPIDDLDDDIRDHIERETADNIDRGMSPDAARAAARRAFGSVALAREDVRAVWIPVWIDQVVQDVRYGLRLLRRHPGFSFIVALTLAVGIGLNTAVFSVVNAVLVRPLSYPHGDRMVWAATIDERTHGEMVTGPEFLLWRNGAQTIERLAAIDEESARIAVGDDLHQVRTATVSDGFWSIAGARPALGRLPAPDERAIVLSHELFEGVFHGDTAVIGKPLTLDNRSFVVVGVLPQGFRVQLPAPPVWSQLEPGVIDMYRSRVVAPPKSGGGIELFNVIAQMKPGVSIEQVRAELAALRAGSDLPPMLRTRTISVAPLNERLIGHARRPLMVLMAAVALVLAIACANIASLMLSRASARRREVAIRTAIGAGRLRLLRQMLVESFILTAIGASGGVLLAQGGIAIALRLIPYGLPRLVETAIDTRALAFTLAVSAGTAMVFGLVSALALKNVDLQAALKDGRVPDRASRAGARVRLRQLVVAAEIAMTIVLLIAAGLTIRSLTRITTYPGGFDPSHVLTMKLQFSGPRYREDQSRRAYVDELLQRMRQAPGIEASGISSSADGKMALMIEGAPPVKPEDTPAIFVSSTSSGYAKAVGMRVLRGRWLSDSESSPVYVVNEAAARRYFPGQDPIGRRILQPWIANQTPATIVGVVADLRYSNLDAAPEPEMFTNYAQAPTFAMTVLMRTTGDPASAAPALRALLDDVDRTQPMFEVRTLETALGESIAPRRFNVLLLATFALSALTLAIVGIYGVIAYSVAQRKQEIGVRMALGARGPDVVGLFVREGMTVAIAGIVAGLAVAIAVTRVVASLLYEVTATDPITFAAVTVVLLATSFAACAIPAARAARVDPLTALRCD